ncbi:MAG TPA: 4-phosphoerythronate dehydrogenase [Bacteroidales bacterium]|nr:4-phosphoerythronate dehydrogenase [Bacteroidales bacterium]
MLKIVADDKIPFLAGVLEPFAMVEYLPGSKIMRNHLTGADALIVRTRTRCNAGLLEGTNVRFIASATIGHDHIDQQYCERKGIAWQSAPGCNSASVVQYMASALALIIRKTGMKPDKLTFGIIGAGNVGKKLIALCETLGIRTLVNDPPRQRTEGVGAFCSLDELLRYSDIVSFHVPLTMTGPDKTYHMAEEGFFKKIKTGAWLVNTSRGEVINTGAIKIALRKDKIQGAVIDVWENEPIIDLELLHMAFLATPHIAGYSADGKANGTAMSVQALSRFFGLGLDDWRPENLPEWPVSVINPDPGIESKMKLFTDLSLKAYPISQDDSTLRMNPGSFEMLRENYPVRREPPALSVNTKMLHNDYRDFISRLGYKLLA